MKDLKLAIKFVFILIILFILFSFAFTIIKRNNNVKFTSSEQHMLAIEQNREDGKTVFYCIFDKKGICISCFCEMENPPKEMEIDETLHSGYIHPKLKENVLYTEYTGLRGYTIDEIKAMFKHEYEKIIKEW